MDAEACLSRVLSRHGRPSATPIRVLDALLCSKRDESLTAAILVDCLVPEQFVEQPLAAGTENACTALFTGCPKRAENAALYALNVLQNCEAANEARTDAAEALSGLLKLKALKDGPLMVSVVSASLNTLSTVLRTHAPGLRCARHCATCISSAFLDCPRSLSSQRSLMDRCCSVLTRAAEQSLSALRRGNRDSQHAQLLAAALHALSAILASDKTAASHHTIEILPVVVDALRQVPVISASNIQAQQQQQQQQQLAGTAAGRPRRVSSLSDSAMWRVHEQALFCLKHCAAASPQVVMQSWARLFASAKAPVLERLASTSPIKVRCAAADCVTAVVSSTRKFLLVASAPQKTSGHNKSSSSAFTPVSAVLSTSLCSLHRAVIKALEEERDELCFQKLCRSLQALFTCTQPAILCSTLPSESFSALVSSISGSTDVVQLECASAIICSQPQTEQLRVFLQSKKGSAWIETLWTRIEQPAIQQQALLVASLRVIMDVAQSYSAVLDYDRLGRALLGVIKMCISSTASAPSVMQETIKFASKLPSEVFLVFWRHCAAVCITEIEQNRSGSSATMLALLAHLDEQSLKSLTENTLVDSFVRAVISAGSSDRNLRQEALSSISAFLCFNAFWSGLPKSVDSFVVFAFDSLEIAKRMKEESLLCSSLSCIATASRYAGIIHHSKELYSTICNGCDQGDKARTIALRGIAALYSVESAIDPRQKEIFEKTTLACLQCGEPKTQWNSCITAAAMLRSPGKECSPFLVSLVKTLLFDIIAKSDNCKLRIHACEAIQALPSSSIISSFFSESLSCLKDSLQHTLTCSFSAPALRYRETLLLTVCKPLHVDSFILLHSHSCLTQMMESFCHIAEFGMEGDDRAKEITSSILKAFDDEGLTQKYERECSSAVRGLKHYQDLLTKIHTPQE